ncbi:MAG: hypothetical protein NC181_03240 [Clostridium sp.]|nr:hypothetical protein [Clostridium sp.]MCM1444305.1 hypothetical protein [Candidatus Amulumruptor caecigallinarius]
MIDIDEILDKYDKGIIENINIDNLNKIINFLQQNGCDYCDELVENYLDLFILDIEEFKTKFNNLNKKYNNNFLTLACQDMNILEEFYSC